VAYAGGLRISEVVQSIASRGTKIDTGATGVKNGTNFPRDLPGDIGSARFRSGLGTGPDDGMVHQMPTNLAVIGAIGR
jgi:hypothetical protein